MNFIRFCSQFVHIHRQNRKKHPFFSVFRIKTVTVPTSPALRVFCRPVCFPAADALPGGLVYPAQARFHSAKNAAVLRLQRTQSKDRRFSKAFAGYTYPPEREGLRGRQKGQAGGAEQRAGRHGNPDRIWGGAEPSLLL